MWDYIALVCAAVLLILIIVAVSDPKGLDMGKAGSSSYTNGLAGLTFAFGLTLGVGATLLGQKMMANKTASLHRFSDRLWGKGKDRDE